MKAFEYAAPRSEAELVQLLSSSAGSVEILAGGTDLVGLMKKMIVTPQRVVNIMEIPSLKAIDELPDGSLAIGAAVTLDVLLDHPYLDVYPAIKQAIHGISSMQLQCQGTLGGEVCQRPQCWFYRNGMGLVSANVSEGASQYHAILGNGGPAKFVNNSRLAPALIVLGAQLRVIGPAAGENGSAMSEQFLPVEQLFRVPVRESDRLLALAPDQAVTHIILPPIAGRTCATYEVRQGQGPDYPLAAAAAALRMDASGTVHEARIAMGHVAPTPWLPQEAAQSLLGQRIDEFRADLAGEIAVSRATPFAGNEYKVQLAKTAVKRAVLLAAGLATGGF
ncbi:MAG: xanthine dehydrogenase family protein subunit M [Pirellulaceae bacterium]